MSLALIAAAGFAYARTRQSCGSAVTSLSGSRSSSPFLDAEGQKQQPDRNRDELVRTLAADPAPIGDVLGAVGYHYEQWAQVSAYAQGIGVRTRDNPDFTMLDDENLRPRWSVEVGTKQSTYDASDHRYLVATMPGGSAPDLVSLDADTGRRVWCAPLLASWSERAKRCSPCCTVLRSRRSSASRSSSRAWRTALAPASSPSASSP